MPVASHYSFNADIDAVLVLAEAFNAIVLLYYVHKPGIEISRPMANNIEEASRIFVEKGIRMICIKEEHGIYTPSYSRQTLNYASQPGVDCICIMSLPSKEFIYFAQSDKETLLLNELHIPVLCAGGGGGKIR